MMKNVYTGAIVTTGVLTLLSGVYAAPTMLTHRDMQMANQAVIIPADTAISFEELRRQSELNHAVFCDFEEVRLDDALEILARQTGVRLVVARELAARKINCICNSKSLSSFQISLARVLDVSWRKAGRGYEVFRTPEQQQTEERQKRKSEQNQQAFLRVQGNRLHQQIVGALFANANNRQPLADFLSGYDLNTIDGSIPSALEDEPILSATDQSHFLRHLFGVRPFSSLSPVQQSAVTQIAQESGYSQLTPNSQIGYIAAAGGMRLGVVEREGRDVWVAPRHEIGQVSGLSEEGRLNDYDAGVIAQIRSGTICDLRQLAQQARDKKLSKDMPLNARHLYEILKNVTRPANVAFISDSHLNSNRTTYSPVLADSSEWTTETAIRQVAKTFGHKAIYCDGFLQMSTLTPGLDARLEAPVDVTNSLDAQQKAGRLPTRDELLALGGCTREQLVLLRLNHPVMQKTQTVHIDQALISYPFVRFYGLLSPAQQRAALSEDGLDLRTLTSVQRRQRDEVDTCRMSKVNPARYNLHSNRFYVKSVIVTLYKGVRRDAFEFIMTTPDVNFRSRSAAL